MQCIHEIRMYQRVDQPLERFVQFNSVLRQLAARGWVSPIEYLADAFVARLMPGESYEDWLCRQVTEVLETSLLDDDYEEGATGNITGTLHQAIRSVRLTPADREYVIQAFSANPELRQMWLMLNGATALAA